MSDATPLHFGPHTIILILGIVQGLFLALLLLASHGPARRAWKWLGLFLLCFSLMQVEDVLYNSRALLRVPQLYNTLTLLVFMLGPSLYLFVRTLLRPDERLGRWEWLHLAPFVLFTALSIPSFFASRATKLAAVQADYATGSYYFNASIILPLGQLVIYLLLIAALLSAHAQRIRGSYSSLAGIDLRWLTRFWVVIMLLGCLWVAFYAMRSATGMVVLNTACTLFVYLFSYVGWREGGVFAKAIHEADAEPAAGAAPAAAKYARSGLTSERKQALLQAAQRIMAEEWLYRDPLLTLPKLARRLAVSPNHLSQAINEGLGQTFFDFVNAHRVQEVKSRLEDPGSAHLTVLALACEAGFNSKSAFNAAFRKHTGTTPKSCRRGS